MGSARDGADSSGSSGGAHADGAAHGGDVGRTRSTDRAPDPDHTRGTPAVPSTLHELEEAVHALEHSENRPPPAGRVTNGVVALVVTALGVAALLGSLSLGIGSASRPGTGTWPLLISVVLLLLGVGLAVTARSPSDAERFSGSSWLVVVAVLTMVVFVALIPVIGFEIPAAVLAFVWLRFLGHESWRSSLVTTLAVVVAFYLVFVAALSIPIPHLF